MTQPDQRQKYWFHARPKLALTLAVVLGCVLSVALLELAARIFLPEWPPRGEERIKYWSYDETLGWSHQPGQKGRFNHRDFSVEVSINSSGQRDDEYAVARSGKKRMLVLGDSFGWGFGVEHHQRFSELLEEEHPGWEIINASVSGYGTDQQLLYLRDSGVSFNPDVVLLMFHESDLRNNINAMEYWYNKPYFSLDGAELHLHNTPVPRSTAKQELQRFLLGRTYLGKIIYNRSGRLRQAISGSSAAAGQEFVTGDKREILAASRDLTGGLIKSMKALLDGHGCRLLVVSVPMGENEKEFLRGLSQESDIPYLALDAFFETTGTEVIFPHDGHWNAAGHRRAAAAIGRFLRDQKIF
jgi:hypothetical protein